jgi:hypothetical protein
MEIEFGGSHSLKRCGDTESSFFVSLYLFSWIKLVYIMALMLLQKYPLPDEQWDIPDIKK